MRTQTYPVFDLSGVNLQEAILTFTDFRGTNLTMADLSRSYHCLLGHVSIQATERYPGCKQRFRNAVNDHIGLEPDAPS